MKANIHPKWYDKAEVLCACGTMFTVGSTKPKIKVEICSKCHPFFTGSMKFVDILGRVEKFQQKQKKAETFAPVLKAQKEKKKGIIPEDKTPKTLREMLLGTT
jgi:large subunit ribosomal protein L31